MCRFVSSALALGCSGEGNVCGELVAPQKVFNGVEAVEYDPPECPRLERGVKGPLMGLVSREGQRRHWRVESLRIAKEPGTVICLG